MEIRGKIQHLHIGIASLLERSIRRTKVRTLRHGAAAAIENDRSWVRSGLHRLEESWNALRLVRGASETRVGDVLLAIQKRKANTEKQRLVALTDASGQSSGLKQLPGRPWIVRGGYSRNSGQKEQEIAALQDSAFGRFFLQQGPSSCIFFSRAAIRRD